MKKLLFILLLLPCLLKAQKVKVATGTPLQVVVYKGALGADSGLYVGSGCGNPATLIDLGPFYAVYKGTIIYKDTCADIVYTSNPDETWTALSNDTFPVLQALTAGYGLLPALPYNGSYPVTHAVDSTVFGTINYINQITNIDSGSITWFVDTISCDPSPFIDGDRILVCANGATGALAGKEDSIATLIGGIWNFESASVGQLLAVTNETTSAIYKLTDTGWVLIQQALLVGGNKIGVPIRHGTIDNKAFIFITRNINRGRIDNLGHWYITDLRGMAEPHHISSDSATGMLINIPDTALEVHSPLYWNAARDTLFVDTTGFGGGGGSVTSVGLAAPSIFTVTGSPVTTSGTLTFSPNNATGDIIYGSGTNTLAYRTIGSTGQHLVVSGGLPVWRDTTAIPTSFPYWRLADGGTLTGNNTIAGAGFYTRFNGGRLQAGQGAAIAAANDLTLGNDGNTFSITGATQINAITTTNWQAGSVVNLVFTSTPTVKNNTAGGAGTAPLLLASSADFVAAANDVLTLVYDGSAWHETSRKQATVGGQFWALPTGGTLTGVNTINNTRIAGINWRSVATTTANNQFADGWSGTLTSRATASDVFIAHKMYDTLVYTAAAQEGILLDLSPIYSQGAFGGTTTAIRHRGNIYPTLANTYSIGTNTLYYNYGGFRNMATETIKTLVTDLFFMNGGGDVFGIMYANNGNLQISNPAKYRADQLYKLDVIGNASVMGAQVIQTYPTPAGTVVPIGGGSTTYSYVIVAKTKTGAHSAASATITTTLGNATLNTSNFNRIIFTNFGAAGEYGFDVYRTVGGATQGKIGTATTGNFDDQGAAGDGTTAPTNNNTGDLVLGGTTGASTLTVNGSTSLGYVAKTGTYTATDGDGTIDCTANTFTVTLPTAVGISGRIYTIVNSGSGTITLATTSSQTFVNISAAPTTLTLPPVGTGGTVSYTVQSNNANWNVVGTTRMGSSEASAASAGAPTPPGDSRDNFYDLTALATTATFGVPTGTPINHATLTVRVKDDGTSRNLAWNAIYRASTDLPLPGATTLGKYIYIKFMYNSQSSTWDLLSVLNGF